jgi:hypothetical protein
MYEETVLCFIRVFLVCMRWSIRAVIFLDIYLSVVVSWSYSLQQNSRKNFIYGE